MEGPSIVIACEELAPFFNRKIAEVDKTVKIPLAILRHHALRSAKSWGKHLILEFDDVTIRIHFLMFGSYRINNPRANRIPKLCLRYRSGKGVEEIAFYSCAIKVLEGDLDDLYDWSIDIMSPKWSGHQAWRKLVQASDRMVCDILMDQNIFAGIGNIIKNEVLFNLRLHPEANFGKLTQARQKALVKEARRYSKQFLRWKKLGVLKKNWLVFRKKQCPVCEKALSKKQTGLGERVSFFCRFCQKQA